LTFAVAQVDLSPVASDEGASSLRSAIRVSACAHSPPRNTTCKLHRNDADRRASSGADHGPVLSLVSYIAVARSSSEADARAAAVLRDQHYEFIRAAGDQGASAGAAAGAAGRVYDLYAHVPPGHIGRRVCSPRASLAAPLPRCNQLPLASAFTSCCRSGAPAARVASCGSHGGCVACRSASASAFGAPEVRLASPRCSCCTLRALRRATPRPAALVLQGMRRGNVGGE